MTSLAGHVLFLKGQQIPVAPDNARFYLTMNGSRGGHLFRRLIHIWALNKLNPVDCVTESRRHLVELTVCEAG